MFRRLIARTSGAAVVAILLAASSMSAATADSDIDAMANERASNGNGYIEFIDDGDRFKVCDTKVNGKGVEGTVGLSIYGDIFGQADDGGDAGCDYFQVDVEGMVPYYMTICDIGASSGCEPALIRE